MNAFSNRNNLWIAIFILLAGILLTASSAHYVEGEIESKSKLEYSSLCNAIKTKISTRLHEHALLLRLTASFLNNNENVTRNDWKLFIANSKIDKNLPGILGVGFSLIIPKNQLQNHITSIRNEGFPTYNVKPDNDRAIYTSIIYLEPFNDKNKRAFGYDMFSEPVRRKAMEQSRDNDIAAISGKVALVQETQKDIQAGALMYVPVYKRNFSTNTIDERRAAIIGWVYSPYRLNDLMEGILGRWNVGHLENTSLLIYDDSVSNQSLLFNSQKADLYQKNDSTSDKMNSTLEFNGKKWIICFSQPKNANLFLQGKVLLLIICGLIISVLLSLLVHLLLNLKGRAQKIAENLTFELKERSEQHQDLSKLLESIIDHVPGLLFYKDKENRFVYVNKFIALAHSKEKAELVGKNISEFYPEEVAQKYFLDDLSVINSGIAKLNIEEPWETESVSKWLNTNKIPFVNSNGETIGIIGISMDITERKIAEEIIKKQNQDLLKLNEDKDRFIFILAHDIKGPFNNVISMLDFSIENIHNSNLNDIEKQLNMASVAAMKVHALLEDILIWIKSQSDKFPIVPQEINFGNIFAELIENTKLSAANKNITINYSAEDKTSIRADKNMIITIIRNLVANAIKFTNAGGEIFLSAEMKFTEIIITVSDNGVGITPNRLIDLFSITKITTTPGTNNEKGTGLGLLICKELVEKHGGKIWAESEIGKGTSFKFSIPISNNQE